MLILSPSSLAVCAHHLFPRIAIVFSLLPNVPNFFLHVTSVYFPHLFGGARGGGVTQQDWGRHRMPLHRIARYDNKQETAGAGRGGATQQDRGWQGTIPLRNAWNGVGGKHQEVATAPPLI